MTASDPLLRELHGILLGKPGKGGYCARLVRAYAIKHDMSPAMEQWVWKLALHHLRELSDESLRRTIKYWRPIKHDSQTQESLKQEPSLQCEAQAEPDENANGAEANR